MAPQLNEGPARAWLTGGVWCPMREQAAIAHNQHALLFEMLIWRQMRSV